MTNQETSDWERWLHVGGSIASLAALGYLLTHLPRRDESGPIAGLGAARKAATASRAKAKTAPKKKAASAKKEKKGPVRNAPLPKFPELTFRLKARKSLYSWADDGPSGYDLSVRDKTGREVATVNAIQSRDSDWAKIGYGGIDVEEYKGKGLYPVMLTKLRDFVKKNGAKGLISPGSGRVGTASTYSWNRFAKREARIRVDKEPFDAYRQGGKRNPLNWDFYFSGLLLGRR